MLICNDDTSYKCSELKQNSVGSIRTIQFYIIDDISPEEIKKIFENDTFYFYDDVVGCCFLWQK